jgi:hypothetical protein
MPNKTGAEVARAFADDGYLTVYDVDRDGETWWESTTKGGALAQASFDRPIARTTEERHLAGERPGPDRPLGGRLPL